MSLRGTAAGRVSKIERKAVKNGLRGEKGKQEQRAGNNEGRSCRCSVVFGAKFGLLELLMRPSWKQRYRSGFHYWTRTLGHSMDKNIYLCRVKIAWHQTNWPRADEKLAVVQRKSE